MKKLILIILSLSAFKAAATDPVLLKTAREIFASYVAITGLSDKDETLRETFRINADRLPKGGAPDELSSTTIMAATELGGAFCKRSLEKEKALPHGQRLLFGDVNFQRGPSQFNDYLKGVILNHLAMAFWQRDIMDVEKKSLVSTMGSAIKDADDTPDETLKLLQVVCTTYATSLAFLVK